MLNFLIINFLNPLITGSIKSSMSDEDVIKKYLDTHDKKYYSILYDRYSNKVYGKCISLLKSESRAEDATQDIFIKILINLSKFSGKSKFSTIEEINDRFLLETNIKRLKIVLEEIPVGDKAILLMKYQDSLSIKEIGAMLEKSESAIKMKIKRAKLKFKKVYSEKYKDLI